MKIMLSFVDLARPNAAAALPPLLLKGFKQTDVSEKCFVTQ